VALRGKKPESVQKRLKAFFYGAAGVGKTTAAIQFPKPYLIDSERGAENDQYVKHLESSGGAIFQTSDFDEMMAEIRSLLTEKHDYKTLIVDPLTVPYSNLLDKAEKKVGSEFGRHYSEANKHIKHMINMLLRLDMNVIITSHAKNEYGAGMTLIGQTFDCYKKLDYLFDVVFEIQKRGKDRVGVVKKTRVEAFLDNETFPFSYAEIAKRYGKEILEKSAEVEVLANTDQLKELNRLIELLKITEETIEKWLKNSDSETFDEMKSDHIQKVIDHLKSQVKGE
jgi:adenosyl cobinamide kinase/adenosyl cobinamide phosphate guanylyltransferase